MSQLVHRHTFSLAEAVHALLPEIGDCRAWELRVAGDLVVVDVVEPALPKPAQNMRDSMHAPAIAPTTTDITTAASEEVAKINTQDSEPELKGGPLARRAAIMCTEKGFWTFADVGSTEDAAGYIRRECGIESRAVLDHDPDAAAKFDRIDRSYRLWLEGYD